MKPSRSGSRYGLASGGEEYMPLWDSVQRGLEKASQEAARIARTQRLRSNIDGLSRQMYAQNNAIFNKTMELFVSGQLTQSELLPLCQEMINLQQQLNQAQNELKQLQAQSNQPPASGPGPQMQAGSSSLPPGPTAYPSTGEPLAPPLYAPPPPDYQTYLDSTHAAGIPDVPPPPPGVEPLSISSIETSRMSTGASPLAERRFCTICQAELLSNHAFCQNCGAPVQTVGTGQLPTMRAGYAPLPSDASTQETMRASTPNYPTTAPGAKDNANIVQPPVDNTSSQEVDNHEGV